MKRKLYTFSYDEKILKSIDSEGGCFTAEEHTLATEKEIASTVLASKDAALKSFFHDQLVSVGALQLVVDEIKLNDFRNVMSFGAGTMCREYILKLALPERVEVMACDFDRIFVERAQGFFPEIRSTQFNFVTDDIGDIGEFVGGGGVDLAVFFASSYVLEDDEFVHLLASLRDIGVRRIIDFGGYIDMKMFIYYLLNPMLKNPLIRRILRRSALPEYRGKFHGFSRSRGELRRLYRKSGLRIIREQASCGFKYIATLEPTSK